MRILLVEDEKRMAQTLCEILRLEKYDVDHYDNGTDGLAAIVSNIYDIVILDDIPSLSAWIKKERSDCFVLFLAPQTGLEPVTPRLTAACSTD